MASAREDEDRGTKKWEKEEDITAKRLHVEDEEEQKHVLSRVSPLQPAGPCFSTRIQGCLNENEH